MSSLVSLQEDHRVPVPQFLSALRAHRGVRGLTVPGVVYHFIGANKVLMKLFFA